MEIALLLAAIVVPVGLNLRATWLVLKDSLSGVGQKCAQLLLVWLVPFIGAAIVLAVRRSAEPPSKKYRDSPDPGEDYAMSGRASKVVREVIDADD